MNGANSICQANSPTTLFGHRKSITVDEVYFRFFAFLTRCLVAIILAELPNALDPPPLRLRRKGKYSQSIVIPMRRTPPACPIIAKRLEFL